MKKYDLEVPISKKNDAIEKNNKKCIICGYCKKVCCDEITVGKMYNMSSKSEPICINCGQCANICPTEAIKERLEYIKVKNILHNKKNKIIIFSVAPAVKTSILEEFGLEAGINAEGKISSALKKIGADYVFDITFGADLTVIEEAMEFVSRIKEDKDLPQFTSCCPAWVKYAEIFYPELISNLSSCKSPIAMQSTIIKTYFANKKKLNPKNIINIVIAPCTAKKSEINRDEINYTSKDTDYVITTREFAMLLKEEKIDINSLRNVKYDNPFKTGSGAGALFGVSGGVCEATIRTAFYFMTGKNISKKELVFSSVRGFDGIKEASVNFGKRDIKVCVCNGMKNAQIIIEKIIKKEVNYDFIEIMACPNGCIGGGGQPKVTLLNAKKTYEKRMNCLYEKDEKANIRFCHENPDIISIYKEYLGKPNSNISKMYLHTYYFDRSFVLGVYK